MDSGQDFHLLLWKEVLCGPWSLFSLESAGVRIVIRKLVLVAMGLSP